MKIALDPPLCSVTVLEWLPEKPIHFTAFLEHDDEVESCKVALWHSSDGINWTQSAFRAVEDVVGYAHIHNKGRTASSNIRMFSLDLPHAGSTPLQFTLKYQLSEETDWAWSGKGEGEDDGRLIFRMSELNRDPSVNIHELFSNIDANVTLRRARSDVSYAVVWDAEAPAAPSSIIDIRLGSPNQLEHYLAPRINPWPWMAPEHGKEIFKIGNNAFLLAFIRSDGLNVVVLPFSGLEDCTTHLVSDEDGNVIIHGRNDGAVESTFRCVVSAGYDFQRTVDAAFYRAKTLLYDAYDINAEVEEQMLSSSSSRPDRWIDGLGYCTWNGIGAELTEEKIIDTLKDLETTGIKISTVVIDDNWQSIENRRWIRFEAESVGFPNGLKGLTKKIRDNFPYIQNIAVWHALFGYWDGIARGGDIDQTYKCTEVTRVPHVYLREGKPIDDSTSLETVSVVDASDVEKLYADFYKFLSESGINAVKCDGQNFIDEIGGLHNRARLTKPYEDALKASGTKHFGHKIIYCMAHVPNIIFHALLLRDRKPVLFRNSDDFFPHEPDSHTWHVFVNALNNIYTSHLNAIPDWDMFQTNVGQGVSEGESYGSLHAVARCISGGPVYITDAKGGHNEGILNQLVAPSPAGYSVNLRPSTTALPSYPYNGYHDKKLLRINNFYGTGREGTSLMAVLNISKQQLTEILRFNEFRGSYADVEYLVRAHRSGDIFGGAVRDSNFPVVFSLQEAGWELFSAVPLQSLPAGTKSTMKICTFGLLGQITGGCAVTNTKFKVQTSGRLTYEITLKAMGKLGIWFSELEKITLDDIMICIDDRAIPESDIKIGQLLEIDTLSAWTSLRKEEDYYSASDGSEKIAVQVTFKY